MSIYQKLTSDSFKVFVMIIAFVCVVLLTIAILMLGCSHPMSSDVMDFINENQHEGLKKQCIKCHINNNDSIDPNTYIIRPWGGEVISDNSIDSLSTIP